MVRLRYSLAEILEKSELFDSARCGWTEVDERFLFEDMLPRAILLVAREVQGGGFIPRSIRFGLAGGVVAIVWNEALRDRVPAAARQRIDELTRRIETGAFRVPRGGF